MTILESIELYSLIALLACGFSSVFIDIFKTKPWHPVVKRYLGFGIIGSTIIIFGNGAILLVKEFIALL